MVQLVKTKEKWIEILRPFYPDFIIEALWEVQCKSGLAVTEERLKAAAQKFPYVKDS